MDSTRMIDRRRFVTTVGWTAIGLGWGIYGSGSRGNAMASTKKKSEPNGERSAKLVIRPGETVATINPNIYGHFAEHLGRCIYDGIWVGRDSAVPNDEGYRKAVLDALRRLKVPVIRWPGGCFADAYHWQDGIGPVEKRPKRWNMWWDQEEPNSFGTDEFLRFCEKVGTAPYICMNVGSGSPEEALAWMEYCNSSRDTHFARLRAANGRAKPYGVRYWGVGNENWGCGGSFDPESYAKEYRRFATYLRRASAGTDVELVACGHTAGNWNARFFEVLRGQRNLVDHISIHHYFRSGDDVAFSDKNYYNLLASVASLEKQIEDAGEAIDDFVGKKRSVGLIVDEWGMWHPQAVTENGLEQQDTLRDAILAACVLNLFNRYASRVSMANIAQTINVLQCVALTEGADTILTPTYHVYDLYKGHMGADLVPCEVDTPPVGAAGSATRKMKSVPAVDASASVNKNKLLVSVVNNDLEASIELKIELSGGAQFRSANLGQLSAADVREYNDAQHPLRVKPVRKRPKASGRAFRYVVPPHSVNTFTFELE